MMLRRIGVAAAIVAGAFALGIAAAPAAGAASAVTVRAVTGANPAVPNPAAADDHPANPGWWHATGHAVFVATNAPEGNMVVAYRRGVDGTLTRADAYPTGGRGGTEPGAAIDPLASQGSLTYDARHRLLYAVNAGSDTLTVFGVRGADLRRVQVLSTRGQLPVSVGVSRDLVYVLDAGGDGAITGFWALGGHLFPIPGSTRSLGLRNPAEPNFLASPSQVAITPDGRDVIVATKTHGTLEVFPLDWFGRSAATPVTTEAGAVPFALSFDAQGRLQVADASGGVYSFTVHRGGSLTRVSPFVPNGQVATCWSVSVRGYLYVANAGSATITGYRAPRDGTLRLLDASGVTATTSAGPVDMAVSADGRYLYQQATGAGAIDEFRVGADGSLTRVGTVTGWPADHGSGPEGIAAS